MLPRSNSPAHETYEGADLVRAIIALLPQDKAKALDILAGTMRLVERFAPRRQS